MSKSPLQRTETKHLRRSVLFLFAVMVICSFCGDNFKSLGRHSWRCKKKMNFNTGDNLNGNQQSQQQSHSQVLLDSGNTNTSLSPSNCHSVKCCCGKICKGIRGLKMHHRTCRVVKDLTDETFEFVKENLTGSYNNDIYNEDLDNNITNSIPDVKPGVKLPKSDDQWKDANLFFMVSLPISGLHSLSIDNSIDLMNSTIYNYFHENFGYSDDFISDELVNKYKDLPKKSLKANLKFLKQSQASPNEIRYVSLLLRNRIRTSAEIPTSEFAHDIRIQNNFWGYVKTNLNSGTSPFPSFNMTTCTTFFRDFFLAKQPSKSFRMPSWIPSLPQPTIPYNRSSPSYEQITKIVRRMKASGSPCPLDKLSVIPFKRCPYLRTYLTELFSLLWKSGEIPMNWKRACTVLVHKKGDTSDPSNFRPITLESVPLKIFTSCVRDSMFSYLSSNNYLEHKIQKGFLPKLSGTFEHTAQMAHVINKARVKQRSLVITLLDLKNAFGEVHHNLIPEILKYHHIPLHIHTIIGNLYSNFLVTEFFSKFFSAINPLATFIIPSWIPSLSQPSTPYDLSPPTYQQITKVIRRIKASGSPCPLDKISIIPYKRCPYLRSFITEVIRVIWLSREVPTE